MKITAKKKRLLKQAEELDIPTTYIDDNNEVHDISDDRLAYAIQHCLRGEIAKARKAFAEITDLKKKGLIK